jgi:superfamily II DNA helicase RecQ
VASQSLTPSNHGSSWLTKNRGIIGMIVLDEIHTLLTSKDFRPVMDCMKKLVRTGIPLTLLTATLPPRLENQLAEMIHLPAGGYTVIRAPTGRKEHQYTVLELQKGEELVEKTAGFITEISKTFEGSLHRGIVFVRIKDHGWALQKLLPGIDFVNGQVTDDKLRAQMILKVEDGLGHNLDNRHHLSYPWHRLR